MNRKRTEGKKSIDKRNCGVTRKAKSGIRTKLRKTNKKEKERIQRVKRLKKAARGNQENN